MSDVSWSRAIVSGIIGLLVGLAATYIINLIIPTTNLGWRLIAVGFATFFSGVFGYLGGAKQQSR